MFWPLRFYSGFYSFLKKWLQTGEQQFYWIEKNSFTFAKENLKSLMLLFIHQTILILFNNEIFQMIFTDENFALNSRQKDCVLIWQFFSKVNALNNGKLHGQKSMRKFHFKINFNDNSELIYILTIIGSNVNVNFIKMITFDFEWFVPNMVFHFYCSVWLREASGVQLIQDPKLIQDIN